MFTRVPRARAAIAVALLILLPLESAAPAFAAQATSAKSTVSLLSRAQGLYAQARYGEATTLLTGPVNRGELTGSALRDARILLGRCYVQTGNVARAKEYFGAVIADDPTYVLDKSKAGQDEIDVFNQVKAATTPAAGAAGGKGKTPASGSAAQGNPPAHKPTAAELGTSEGSKGWLATHKTIAALVVVGAGAAGVAIAAGGGSSSSPKAGPATIGAFPAPPAHP